MLTRCERRWEGDLVGAMTGRCAPQRKAYGSRIDRHSAWLDQARTNISVICRVYDCVYKLYKSSPGGMNS